MHSDRVLRWKAAWEGTDAARVAALYTANATHASAAAYILLPDLGRAELRGRNELHRYTQAAMARVQDRRFDIIGVITQGDSDVVEYLRYSSIDRAGPKHVAEILQWEGALLCAVRVFHF